MPLYFRCFFKALDLPIDHLTATSAPPSQTCEAVEAENIYLEGSINFDKGKKGRVDCVTSRIRICHLGD